MPADRPSQMAHEDEDEDKNLCIICLGFIGEEREDESTERALTLPCKHVYGDDCLKKHIKSRGWSVENFDRWLVSFGRGGPGAKCVDCPYCTIKFDPMLVEGVLVPKPRNHQPGDLLFQEPPDREWWRMTNHLPPEDQKKELLRLETESRIITVAQTPNDKCVFCQKGFGTDGPRDHKPEKSVVLRCGHRFGTKCIKNWVWDLHCGEDLDNEDEEDCPEEYAHFFQRGAWCPCYKQPIARPRFPPAKETLPDWECFKEWDPYSDGGEVNDWNGITQSYLPGIFYAHASDDPYWDRVWIDKKIWAPKVRPGPFDAVNVPPPDELVSNEDRSYKTRVNGLFLYFDLYEIMSRARRQQAALAEDQQSRPETSPSSALVPRPSITGLLSQYIAGPFTRYYGTNGTKQARLNSEALYYNYYRRHHVYDPAKDYTRAEVGVMKQAMKWEAHDKGVAVDFDEVARTREVEEEQDARRVAAAWKAEGIQKGWTADPDWVNDGNTDNSG